MARKTGFGATLGCLFLMLLFLVASVAVAYAYNATDTAYMGNDTDANNSTVAAQHRAQQDMLLLVDMILWGITIVMAGVTLIVALTML